MAEDLWTRELQIDREVMGTDHPQTALVMGHLAEAWALDGDFDRARNYSRQAVEIMNTHFDHVSTPVACALVNDGMVEQHARNFAGAAQRYSAALAIFQSSSSESGAEERAVSRLYKAAAARSPHSGSTEQTNGFMKNK